MKTYIKLIGLTLILLLAGVSAQGQDLEAYLKIAADENPRVQAAYTRFEAALKKSPQVASLPDPALTVSAFGQMVETRLGPQEAKFTLMQMFPWFGTLEAKGTAADLMAQAKFQQYLQTREELFLEVKNAYADMYEVNKTIKEKKADLEILNTYRNLALNKFESGSAPMVNVVKVDIKREESSTEIELLEEELSTLKKQFNYLINRAYDAQVIIQDTLDIPSNMTFEEGKTISFEDHPKVEMLDRESEAYESEKLAAKKSGLPNLGVGIDYGIISKRTDADPVNNGQDVIMPMFSISLPIFRKKYKAAREEAELMQEASLQQKEAVMNEMKSDYEMALYNFKKSKRLLELYDKQIESSGQANKLLVSGFSNANSDFEEVLQMNQDVLMFKIQKISAEVNAFKAASKIEFLQFKDNSNENE